MVPSTSGRPPRAVVHAAVARAVRGRVVALGLALALGLVAAGAVARADPPAPPADAPAAPAAPPPAPAKAPAPAGPDVEVFTRPGCPHCAAAKVWLADLVRRTPTVRVLEHDVVHESGALDLLEKRAIEADVAAVATPAFWVRGRLVIGWVDAASTGRRIESILSGKGGEAGSEGESCPAKPKEEAPCAEDEARETVDVPIFGRVRARDLGLPLFTVVVGLLDGFNPCAMWVLVFLLSLLVNLNSRSKMLLVAGTFVFVSGLVYFAFMAAWLNVFLLVGFTRAIQVILGGMALFAGAVHVKDFFALHEGVTLSIPESAKPRIYDCVRRILGAERLGAALVGVTVLAFLVNTVELLCTAGLPAVYTQVLASHPIPRWQHYGYLALYQVFYMLDDTIMLGIAVVTLSRRRLQEKSGRVLKLVSGAVMLGLGLALILKPDLLRW